MAPPPTRRARFDASSLAKLVRPHALRALLALALTGVRCGFSVARTNPQMSFKNLA